MLGMLLNPTITHAQSRNVFILESPILELIDGIPFCIDGYAIKDMKRMRRIIKLLQFGSSNKKTGLTTGRYHFEDKTYGLYELAHIEQSIMQQLSAHKTPELEKKAKVLHEILEQAKLDFARIVEPFLETIQGTKAFITVLITQSCQKRNRMDSYLFDWARCKGNERESFKENVKSIMFLNTFCTDLFNFLGDFGASCPLGNRKYKELKAKEQAGSTAGAKTA